MEEIARTEPETEASVETGTVTLGQIGSKTLTDVDIRGGENAEALFARLGMSTRDRDLLVNQEQQPWSYEPRPGDFLMTMSHVSAGR